MPDIPERIRDFILLERSAKRVSVDRRRMGDPLFLTWLDRMRRASGRLDLQPMEMDELAKLRLERGNSEPRFSAEAGLETRDAALELIARGASLGGSDIHLLLRGTYAEAQIRIKGDLRVMGRMSMEEGMGISRSLFQGIATIKDSSYNPMEFQNAQISGDEMRGLGLTSVRMVRGPSYPVDDGGGFVVLRLQYPNGMHDGFPDPGEVLVAPRKPVGELKFAGMGYTDLQVKKLKFLARSPNGVILFTGPTGSGKTTTLHEMMIHVAREWPEVRQVTIEDPVEYPMEWAVQMTVTNAANASDTGNAFAARLRTSLRMDPDIILVGEIRDKEVARVTLEAAMTGHQVWSTLHVTDPFLAIDRIEGMDPVNLSRRVVCDHKILRGIIAQRLVPRLCAYCAEPIGDHLDRLPDGMWDALVSWGDMSGARVRGKGCSKCGGDGISGRMAVAEVVVTDAALMRDFVEKGSDEAGRRFRARKDTDKSLLGNAIARVMEGVLDPVDVERNVDVILPFGEEVDGTSPNLLAG